MTALRALGRKPWIWSFVAAILVWIITVLFTGGASSIGLSQAALTLPPFPSSSASARCSSSHSGLAISIFRCRPP